MSDITEKWLKELRKMPPDYQEEEMRYMECVIKGLCQVPYSRELVTWLARAGQGRSISTRLTVPLWRSGRSVWTADGVDSPLIANPVRTNDEIELPTQEPLVLGFHEPAVRAFRSAREREGLVVGRLHAL